MEQRAKLSVQEALFSPSQELDNFLRQVQTSEVPGAVCHFLGLVRQHSDERKPLKAMRLEHYPGMTEKVLQELINEAEQKFSLQHVRLLHRFGLLQAGEVIVMVITASPHRADAFLACEFLMDRLKTDAPFWKCEYTEDGEAHWVEAKACDDTRARKWK